MKDLAILVDNKNDSTEAQDLLFSMGYKWRGLGEISKSYFYPKMNKYFIFMNKNEMDLQMAGYFAGSSRSYAESRFKEITLPELRDMVNPMKEYLFKYNDQYTLVELSKEDAGSNPEQYIEIPEGCNIITCENRNGNLVYFHWKSLDSDEFFLKDEKIWSNNFNETLSDFIEKNEGDVKIIWSRHTLPEELPFIDDEPSLNDQYAEIEKVRQDIINSPNHYADSTIECIDAMEAMMTPEQFIGYLRGNVFKYQWRYEKKNGIEDLKKAQWYLERLTEKVAEKNAPF